MGVNARIGLTVYDCIIDNLTIGRSHTDSLVISHSRVSSVNLLGVDAGTLEFHQCEAYKSRGKVIIQECEIEKVSGLEQLGNGRVTTHVDALMWRDLGDNYLKKIGIRQHTDRASGSYDLLDSISQAADLYREA